MPLAPSHNLTYVPTAAPRREFRQGEPLRERVRAEKAIDLVDILIDGEVYFYFFFIY
jgi:hypothetical protein